jgi:hypothetical protein
VTDHSIDPLAQQQAEAEITRLSERLTDVTNDLIKTARRAAQAKVDYELKHAEVWLELRGFNGTVPEKEATALDRCSDLYQSMEIAKSDLRVLVISAENLRSQLSALQSISANVRALVTGR